MPSLFKRFVEIGRAVVVRFGPESGKPAVIVDIVDLNRVIIDGPSSEVQRQVIPLKRLQLTDFRLEGLRRGASSKALSKALESDDVVAQWKASAWGKKRATFENKRKLNDFERFQYQRAKSIIAKAVRS